MLRRTSYALLVLVSLFSGTQDARGQSNVDELWSNWPLGGVRGRIVFRVPREEMPKFEKFVSEFAIRHGLIKFVSSNRPILSGREFISDWYRSFGGVTMFVTDITLPEKVQVAFYGRTDGKGVVEADRAFLDFTSLGSGFKRYE